MTRLTCVYSNRTAQGPSGISSKSLASADWTRKTRLGLDLTKVRDLRMIVQFRYAIDSGEGPPNPSACVPFCAHRTIVVRLQRAVHEAHAEPRLILILAPALRLVHGERIDGEILSGRHVDDENLHTPFDRGPESRVQTLESPEPFR